MRMCSFSRTKATVTGLSMSQRPVSFSPPLALMPKRPSLRRLALRNLPSGQTRATPGPQLLPSSPASWRIWAATVLAPSGSGRSVHAWTLAGARMTRPSLSGLMLSMRLEATFFQPSRGAGRKVSSKTSFVLSSVRAETGLATLRGVASRMNANPRHGAMPMAASGLNESSGWKLSIGGA